MGVTGTRCPDMKAASAMGGRRLCACTPHARPDASGAWTCRGSVSVEMALALPFLLLLPFSIIEWGLISRDAVALGAAARGLSRDLALGKIPGPEEVGVSGIGADHLTITYELSPWDENTRTCGDWGPLPAEGAESGDRIRATLTYEHSVIFGRFCVPASHLTEDETIILTAKGMTTRE